MSPRHFALLLLVNLVWGFNYVASKYGVTHLPPLLFTGLRFVILLAVLAAFLKWKPGEMRGLALIALFGGVLHFGLMFTGVSLSDAAVVAVLSQLNAPFATLLSILFLGETVGWRRWLGMGLAFTGVMFIGFDPRVFSYIEGATLVIGAALAMAISQVFMRQTKSVTAFEVQAWLAAFTAPGLLIGSFLIESGQWGALADAPLLVFAALFYTAIGASLFGHSTMVFMLQRYELSLISTLTLLSPIFGIVFSLLVLGERLSGRVVLGAAITLFGILIIAVRQSKAKLPAPPATEAPLTAPMPALGAAGPPRATAGDERP